MIYEDHLLKEALKYCELRGIKCVNGRIPEEHVREVGQYIQERTKKERSITRRLEQVEKMKVAWAVNELLAGVKTGSPIEDFMLMGLARHGLADLCKPQFKIGKKIVDFAFPEQRLVVECDGKEYHFTEKWQIERDQDRDKYLARKGWRVLHIEGLAIRRNIELCMEKVKEALAA